MFEKIVYAGLVFASFLAIMNPISSVSIFLSLTNHEKEAIAKKIAFQSIITAFVIVIIFSVTGSLLLKCFGITFTALRLTGGVLVAIIGYQMLNGGKSSEKDSEPTSIKKTIDEKISVALTPLGTPLLSGPGVIITSMNYASGGLTNCLITISTFGFLCIITYYLFIFGKQVKKIIGFNVLKVVTKIMGLIVSVIGMQMMLEGIYSAIKEF